MIPLYLKQEQDIELLLIVYVVGMLFAVAYFGLMYYVFVEKE